MHLPGSSRIALTPPGERIIVGTKAISHSRVRDTGRCRTIPGVGEPALVLTPPGTMSEAEDVLLTASEIARLDLVADLVVLGAGAPDGEAGADWLSRLAEAFFGAGARSLMVARWSVERAAATTFITTMFAGRDDGDLRGLARLLQRSVLENLNDEMRTASFAHPM